MPLRSAILGLMYECNGPAQATLIQEWTDLIHAYVLRFAEFVSIDQAEMLRGAKLMVPVGDRPPLAEGEFHVMDLVGLTVIDGNTKETIGTVVGIANAGNDLLEIEPQNAPGQKILVPMVKAFVKSLNLQTRQIELLPIPGLIPDLSHAAE